MNKLYIETPNERKDLLDSVAYLVAVRQANTIHDKYISCYIKNKPRRMPLLIYKYLIKKLFVLEEFTWTKFY